MAKNETLKKTNKFDISISDFEKAISLALRIGITSNAPLGCSGDDIIIYNESGTVSRCNQISVRQHNNMMELLITSKEGSFLFYGKYSNSFNITYIACKFYEIYNDIVKLNVLDKTKRGEQKRQNANRRKMSKV